jgi:pyruvate dehydrogenase E2 component (dihydrolipoamide acetyltransferase)
VEAATLHTAVLSTPPVVPPAPQSAAPQQTAPAETVRPQDADTEQVPLSRIRKVTARRLAESMRTAPHFYLTRVVDVEELLAFRATLNAALAPAKVSVNDLIVKACATALRANPVLNVSFTEDYLLVHKRVNIGVAVALEEGLVVPVIRDADQKSVSQLGAETRELAGRAREQRLTPQEMSGGTFTVSNLGMFGVDAFTAVINPPEAAILAVGATRKDVVFRDGEVIPRDRMTLTLSIDHRACDGATGAAFLGQLADLLENPFRIVA